MSAPARSRPQVEIVPLAGEHLEGAGALLAERHERHRAAEPLLPPAGDAAAHVVRELEGGAGVAALRGASVAGYLVGAVRETPGGPTATVGFAGCAADDPELVRDLYAALAADWVEQGVRRHAVAVPASDAGLLDAWFRLAFGCQFVWALREVAEPPPVEADVAVRPGTPTDLAATAGFDRLLWELQAGSPSFSGREIPSEDAFAEEWADTWDDPEQFVHFVADRDGRVVGHLLLYHRPAGDLRVPAGSIDLAHAATLPDVRGSGVGLALAAHALRYAHEHGFRAMTTDWRSVNLLSSRFWPRRGFRPAFLRLYRAVP